MNRTKLAALALCAASAVVTLPAAHAVPGYATPRLEIKAGPRDDYPVVATVRYDTRLEVHRCLRDWRWCEVSAMRARGWVRGRDIQIDRSGRRLEWGAPWNIPQSDFDRERYWNENYRGQDFYQDRDRWRSEPDGKRNDWSE